jgi:hypothetical protein
MSIDLDYFSPFVYSADRSEAQRTLVDQATAFAAEAVTYRALLWPESAPTKAPFWIDISDGVGHVATVSAGGDLREARRKLAAQSAEWPGARVVLTDSLGKALR